MTMIENLVIGLDLLINPFTLFLIVIGLIYGIITGALPGIGASLGMAIVLPLTLPLDGFNAIMLLVSIYSGSTYGASTSAILFNIPGSGSSAATTLDGYPMTRKGEGKTALGISATASAVGGIIGILTLLVLSPFILELLLIIGTPEYFLVALLGLSMIAVVTRTSILKGTVTGAFGMLVGTVGIAPSAPTARYTFGRIALYDGIHFIAVLIGLFAIGEMIKLSKEQGGIAKAAEGLTGSVKEGFYFVFKNLKVLFKSAYIGIGIGAIPGSGSSVSNFVAYTEQVRSSKDPDSYGKGNPKGVMASETSNNALIGGALIPTLSFGIPGGGATAVLLGGLIMHGLRPGPALFGEQAGLTYGLYLGLIFGNFIILGLGLSVVTQFSYISKIDTNLIIPTLLPFAVLGALTLRNNWIDVVTVLAFGILGYFLYKYDWSIIALILGVILGPIAESNFLRSLKLGYGSYSIFFERVASLILIVAIIFILFGPFISNTIEYIRSKSI